jgi:hypothetical protein
VTYYPSLQGTYLIQLRSRARSFLWRSNNFVLKIKFSWHRNLEIERKAKFSGLYWQILFDASRRVRAGFASPQILLEQDLRVEFKGVLVLRQSNFHLQNAGCLSVIREAKFLNGNMCCT